MDGLDLLIELIKKSEGCYLRAYKCPAGVWTCGYGITGPNITESTKFTMAYAEATLRQRATGVMQEAIRQSPVLLDEKPERVAAIADFIFNLGPGAYRGSTLKKKVDARDWKSAQTEIMRWNHCNGKVLKGLTIRRQAEKELLT